MSRILFDARAIADSGSHARGGIARVSKRILAHLRETHSSDEIVLMTTGWRNPHAPTLSHPERDEAEPRPYNTRSPIHLPLPNKLWSLACVLGLTSLDRVAEKIAKQKFDELFLPNIGFIGTPRIPYTILVHDLSSLIEPKWFSWKMRLWHHAVRAKRLIQNAANVWCVSETTARDVERLLGVERKRVTVLPPDLIIGRQDTSAPLHPTTYDPSVHSGQALRPTPYVISFGCGNPRKNISTAIAAAARVREDASFQNLQLFIIGSSSHSPLPTPHSWITFLPSISDNERDHLYQNASALLYPSWYEGFGLPIHEAARFNIPILASAHGALPETAPKSTILINPAKPHLWAGALRNVLKKPSMEQ